VSIASGTWFDAGGSAFGTGITRFNGGSLNLRTNIIPGLRLTGGSVHVIASTFQQAGAITNLTLDGSQLVGTNRVGTGTLTVNSGGLEGQITILTGGTLLFATTANKNVYNLTLLNQGTVAWSGGNLLGGSTSSTTISNGGLWQITGSDQIYQTYGGPPLNWLNSGMLQKSAGTGSSLISDFNFHNASSGQVQSLSGTLQINAGSSNRLGGTLNAGPAGLVTIGSGIWYDAGGSASGPGTNRFNGGTLNLRTNIIANLRLTGGSVFITANTFQQAGAITNLALDGSQLMGTNRVGTGHLVVRSGGIEGRLTVLPAGTLEFTNSANKNVYNLQLHNQGRVNWSGGNLLGGSTASTTVSNGGIWEITGNNQIYQTYGGPALTWTNTGTIRKSGGSDISHISDFRLINTASGIIESDVGTLQLPLNHTNSAGTLRLDGGTLQANGTLHVDGGSFDGEGTIGVNAFRGGTLTPGEAGPGLIHFKSGLNFHSGTTLSLNGTGTTPGTGFDQLTVAGAVSLSNATLQVTSAPQVPAGTILLIIQNDSTDPVSGIFNGLPQNGIVSASGQNFRVNYSGGTGNDVTLVKDSGAGPPQLGGSSWSNNLFRLKGTGGASTVYVIQATTNFLQWTNVGRATGDVSGAFLFTDTNAFRFRHRFYRAVN
ncbi:MAG TPA: hypothetical protein VEH04_01600, partial [Verrucomicrobiae bacterium]|nr:hypothetical protein [Verrucomicrobiae bacterium]